MKALHQVKDYCGQNKVPCFFLNIPPMNLLGLNKYVNDLNAQMHKKFAPNVIDVYTALNLQGTLKQKYGIGDGVHLSREGYRKVAETIFSKLLQTNLL